MKTRLRRIGGPTAIVLTLGVAALPCAAQENVGATSLTIYSTARPADGEAVVRYRVRYTW